MRSVGRQYAGLLGLVWLLAASSAWAQMPYGITPLSVAIDVRPGGTREAKISVHSLSTKDTLRMPFEIRPLVQTRSGTMRLGEAGEQVPRACVDWLQAAPGQIELKPREVREIAVRATAPRDARGTYLAALLTNPEPVKGKPQNVAEGTSVAINMVFRVAVVIEINIVGPTPARSCEVSEAQLRHVTLGKDPEARHITAAVVTARNTGETAMRLRPKLSVYADRNGRPTRLWSTTGEVGRLHPGVEADFILDTGRLWPGGKYQIRATLDSDGSQVASAEFETDLPQPTGGTVSELGDIPLQITPDVAHLDTRPGSNRAVLIKVANVSEITAHVNIAALMPNEIKSQMSRSADDLANYSCDEWVELQPAEFDLPPGRSRNVRMLARVPADAQGSYYARLLIKARDPSDTIHVQTETLAWISTPGEVTRQAELGPLQVSSLGGSRYDVTASLLNTGTIHLEPKASVSVLAVMETPVAGAQMTTDKPLLLRSAETTLAGSLDLRALRDGDYDLKCVVALAEGHSLTGTAVIRVKWDGGRQDVSLVVPGAEEAADGAEGGADAPAAPAPEGPMPAGAPAATETPATETAGPPAP